MDEMQTPVDKGMTNEGPSAKPASEFQQKQFDLLLGRARQVLGANAKEWLIAIKADPVQSAVSFGTQTVREMAMMSEKAGQKVDPAVLLHVGIQFIKDVAALANEAGALPDDQIESFLQEVMSQSMMAYFKMDADEGLLTPQEQQQAQGMLANMQGQPQPPQAAPQAAMPPQAAPQAQQPASDEDMMAGELAQIRKNKGV